MVRDTKDSKKKMLEALEYNLGIVSTSCASAGVSRATHYRWINEDEEYNIFPGNWMNDFGERVCSKGQRLYDASLQRKT